MRQHVLSPGLPRHTVLKRLGCVTEIISWRTCVFAPGADVMSRLLELARRLL